MNDHYKIFTCPVCDLNQTEVVKGPCGSVGMTFRHVPATEGDAVHVSIETVTPNSPAALADLQRGDRLIAIGGQGCLLPATIFWVLVSDPVSCFCFCPQV